MRPTHEESRQLVAMLTRTVASNQNTPANPSRPNKIAVAPPAPDISSDTFALFATRVQPILMNTCISCHTGGRGGDFQLIRTEGGQRSSTQANLAAVMAQVRVDNAILSPLLIKAVSPHGNAASAPIKDRKSIPFQTLQGWIEYVLVNNPHLKYKEKEVVAEKRGTTPPIAIEPAKETPNAAVTKGDAPSSFGANMPVNEESRINGQDSFDPAVFNRQAHPRK